MPRDDDPQFETPEEAVRAGFPPKARVRILGVRADDDRATVWLLTNDGPPYEAYTMTVFRDADGWTEGDGVNGLVATWIHDLPRDVTAAAAELGWQ